MNNVIVTAKKVFHGKLSIVKMFSEAPRPLERNSREDQAYLVPLKRGTRGT